MQRQLEAYGIREQIRLTPDERAMLDVQRQLEAYGIRELHAFMTAFAAFGCKGSSKPTEFERSAWSDGQPGGLVSAKAARSLRNSRAHWAGNVPAQPETPKQVQRQLEAYGIREGRQTSEGGRRSVVQRQLEAYGIREKVVAPRMGSAYCCAKAARSLRNSRAGARRPCTAGTSTVQRQLEAYGIRER